MSQQRATLKAAPRETSLRASNALDGVYSLSGGERLPTAERLVLDMQWLMVVPLVAGLSSCLIALPRVMITSAVIVLACVAVLWPSRAESALRATEALTRYTRASRSHRYPRPELTKRGAPKT